MKKEEKFNLKKQRKKLIIKSMLEKFLKALQKPNFLMFFLKDIQVYQQ